MNKCEKCIHNEICSKKEAYAEALSKINKDSGEFEVELKCKWYKDITVANFNFAKKQIEQQYPNYPPQIGDSTPCNPLKPTIIY